MSYYMLPLVAIKNATQRLNQFLTFFLIFSASTILVTAITGFFFINSLFSVLAAIVVSLVLWRRRPFTFSVSPLAWLLFFLLLALLIYPVVFTHGIAASADGVTTISMRVLQDHIPATYAPYTDVTFSYQLGFPLLARVLHDLISFIPDYQFVWMLGALFGALLVPLVFAVSQKFFSSERVALTAVVLVFGSKLVFENFYWGEYAWLAATIFFLWLLLLWKENHSLVFLVFPTIATLHPAILANTILFLVFLLWKQLLSPSPIFSTILSLVLALPAVVVSYIPLFSNLLAGNGTGSGISKTLFSNALALPPWIGLGLSILLFFSLLLSLWKKPVKETPAWLWQSLAIFLLFFLAFSALGSQLANREIELVFFSVLFLAAFLFSNHPFLQTRYAQWLVLFLVIGLVSFSTAGTLQKSRLGSKISSDEIQFALAFRQIDPTVQHTLFLTPGGGKMAELSNKKPFDVNSGQLITMSELLVVHNAVWQQVQEKHRYQEFVIQTNCAACILSQSDLEYVVINSDFTTIALNKPIVARQGALTLYRLR